MKKKNKLYISEQFCFVLKLALIMCKISAISEQKIDVYFSQCAK